MEQILQLLGFIKGTLQSDEAKHILDLKNWSLPQTREKILICSYCDVRCIHVVWRFPLRRRQTHSWPLDCKDRRHISDSCLSASCNFNNLSPKRNIKHSPPSLSYKRWADVGLTGYHRAASVLAAVAVLQSCRVVALFHSGVTNQLWRHQTSVSGCRISSESVCWAVFIQLQCF